MQFITIVDPKSLPYVSMFFAITVAGSEDVLVPQWWLQLQLVSMICAAAPAGTVTPDIWELQNMRGPKKTPTYHSDPY